MMSQLTIQWGVGDGYYLKDRSVGLASNETNLVYWTDPGGLISLVEKTNWVGFVVTHDLAWLGRYLQLTLRIIKTSFMNKLIMSFNQLNISSM